MKVFRHRERIFPLFLLFISAVSLIVAKVDMQAPTSKTSDVDDAYGLGQQNFEKDSIWQSAAEIADKDGNGMSDDLEARITESYNSAQDEGRMLLSFDDFRNGKSPGESDSNNKLCTEAIPVIVHFPPGNIDKFVSLFQDLGGELKSVYSAAINGFAGTIDLQALNQFCDALRVNEVPFIAEEDKIVKSQLYYASRNMNLRPLTWTTYGYRGDPSTAVAVIDSGIDDSHSAFAPGYASLNQAYKITGWRDEVSSYSAPYDGDGHGSHCAGIVAGSGNYTVDGSSRFVATYGEGYDYSGYYIPDQTLTATVASFNVTQAGTIEIQCQFDDYTPGSDAIYVWAYLYRQETVVDSYTVSTSSWTDTLTYSVTLGLLGDYSLRLRYDFYGSDGDCDNPYMRFRGIIHWPFNPAAMGTSNLWQGVAPDSKLVGVRVRCRCP